MNKEQAAKEYADTHFKTMFNAGSSSAFIAGWEAHEQHTHPHSTYMEFAEWVESNAEWVRGRVYNEPMSGMFQYWITNVKNKG